jgi:hypothetical protein
MNNKKNKKGFINPADDMIEDDLLSGEYLDTPELDTGEGESEIMDPYKYLGYPGSDETLNEEE